ncbi:MAG: RNA polymerase sigma factor [Clostridia bacterium]|nr:RNA polymerase sigma factor [Clostridia bacterium]
MNLDAAVGTHITVSEKDELDIALKGTLAGDTDAMAELYRLTRVAVYSFAFSIVKSHHDAEDIAHDTYLSLFGSHKHYISHGKAMAYILTATKNHALMKLRHRKRLTDFPEDYDRTPDDSDGVSAEEKLLIRQCLDKLSDSERQIVVLHAVSGLKHKEIASLMSLPLSTVLSKYSRAIKKLQAQMN